MKPHKSTDLNFRFILKQPENNRPLSFKSTLIPESQRAWLPGYSHERTLQKKKRQLMKKKKSDGMLMMTMTHQVGATSRWHHFLRACDSVAHHRCDSQTSAASGWSPWQQPCCHDRLPISHLTVPAGRRHSAHYTMRKTPPRIHGGAQTRTFISLAASSSQVKRSLKTLAETLT